MPEFLESFLSALLWLIFHWYISIPVLVVSLGVGYIVGVLKSGKNISFLSTMDIQDTDRPKD